MNVGKAAGKIVPAIVGIAIQSLSFAIALSASTIHSQDDHFDAIEKFENAFATGARFEGDPSTSIFQRMEHYDVPGVSIAVVDDFKVVWTKAYGVMDRETGRSATPDSVFPCAAISQPVTAAAVLRLVDMGKLDLRQDVNNYLNSWKLPVNGNTRKPITLRHLLGQSSCIFDRYQTSDEGHTTTTELRRLIERLDLEDSTLKSASSAIELGHEISRINFVVLQQILLDAYPSKSLPQILDELVLNPLDMSSSTFNQNLSFDASPTSLATGYQLDGTPAFGSRSALPETVSMGLHATAADVAKFFIELQIANNGNNLRLLSSDITQKMLARAKGRRGLGVEVMNHAGELYMGQSGNCDGYSSQAIFHQDRGYGVVVMTNGSHPEFVEETIRAIARTYQWHHYFIPMFECLPVTRPQAELLAGRYDDNGDLITISEGKDCLLMSTNGGKPIKLYRIMRNCFASRHLSKIVCFSVNGLSFQMPWDGKPKPSEKARRLRGNEHHLVEWLLSGDVENAIKHCAKANASTVSNVSTSHLNRLGNHWIAQGKNKIAQCAFKVDAILHPDIERSSSRILPKFVRHLVSRTSER